MRELRLREVKELAQNCPARNCIETQVLNSRPCSEPLTTDTVSVVYTLNQ